MKNKIEDLRNHLFETIEMLKDRDDPMDLDRAKTIAQVANSIIESAKTEVKFLEVAGASEGRMPQFFGRPALSHPGGKQ
ncbi:MAG: hypothetical protein AB1450_13320 [Pseudomonadota bacterium]